MTPNGNSKKLRDLAGSRISLDLGLGHEVRAPSGQDQRFPQVWFANSGQLVTKCDRFLQVWFLNIRGKGDQLATKCD